jgi:hypothetical protein
MIFGTKNIYAIEVYHKPLDDSSFYMTGRLCIHLFNKSFGDINEKDCALYEPYITLVEKIKNINILEYNFKLNNDFDIFNFLDEKLYVGEKRPREQIYRDLDLYNKFDFMTNMGEMFNCSKSFLYMDCKKMIHILYQIHDEKDEIICNNIDKILFENISNDFIKWYEETEKNKMM